MFQYWESLRRRKKGIGVQRDEEVEERNIKIRVKGKCVFSYMCFFNEVCREREIIFTPHQSLYTPEFVFEKKLGCNIYGCREKWMGCK